MPLDEDFVGLMTGRLIIRRFRPSDAELLADYRGRPEVARFQSWDAGFNASAARRFIQSMGSRHPGEPGTWFQFAVATREDDRLIGDCGLCSPAVPPWLIELGFSLAPERQGRGYAGEALRAIAGYAFRVLGAEAVAGVTDRRNLPARRLMESIGWARLDGEGPAPPSGPLLEHEVMYVYQAPDPGGDRCRERGKHP